VKIEYEQSREEYERKGYTATRGRTKYAVAPTEAKASTSTFSEVVEVPKNAQNIRFHLRKPPEKYQAAVQDVR
jgi:hypothetical protein